MGVRSALNRLFRRGESGTPGPSDDFWYGPTGQRTLSKQVVTEQTALRIAAVYACVRVLSETLAQVPLITYRRLTPRGRERANTHPLYDVLHSKPNSWQTSFVWRQQAMVHLLLHGNAYSRIVAGPRGFADQLVPLNPLRMQLEQLDTGRILYRYTPEKGQRETYTQDEIFHLRGMTLDGMTGLSPIAYHRETLGMAMAQQEYAARFYANDARPGGTLEHPGSFKNPETADKIKDEWQKIYAGQGRHSVALLQEGMKFTPLQMSHEDMQFIETRKFSVTDIARLFRVPPHMIADLDRATFSNIEEMALEFVTYSITPWFVLWEQQISADLILAPQYYYAEFLTDGLLRGNMAARYTAYAVGRNNGWLSANEIREKENLNPRSDAGGDAYLDPLNMQRSDQPAMSVGTAPSKAAIYLNGYGKDHN